mgnify:FL=1
MDAREKDLIEERKVKKLIKKKWMILNAPIVK